MRPADLLCLTELGLCCQPGGFHIDPLRLVDRALITHAHADHARPGHGAVMATRETLDLMRLRYGDGFAGTEQEARLGEIVEIGGVRVSFHPAGHVLGSAQIALEWSGLRIVVSGDYKCRPDPTCRPFEPVPCDIFVTEATFALPVFRHPDDRGEAARLIASARQFPERAHIVGVYALGKAQRLIALLRQAGYGEPIYVHGALQKMCDYYRSQGIDLGRLEPATIEKGEKGAFAGAIVLGPPSALADRWARRFPEPLAAFASGWMRIRQRARQRGVELPLVISDHCDWDELTGTIDGLRPREVWVTHGREEALVRWCELAGIAARPLHLVGYEEEEEV
jgi:putative mRNA 3-end processing factor